MNLMIRLARLEAVRAARLARMAKPIGETVRMARIVDMTGRAEAGSTDPRCLRVAELMRGAELRDFA